jgi:transcriptional antiterminator RfaH
MIDSTKRWYAVYTRSRAEKKVAVQLEKNGIEMYLPLQKTLRQWSDRKKMIYEPLFRCYVFVKVNNKDFFDVLSVSGAVCFVSIANKKIPIPECQIDAIKTYLGELIINDPLSYFKTGSEVEVAYGALKGLRGILISTRNQRKLIVRIDAVYQNITLTLPSHLLRKITRQAARQI